MANDSFTRDLPFISELAFVKDWFDPLVLAAVGFGLAALLLLAAALRALRRGRPLRFALHTLSLLLALSVTALLAGIAIATQGYRALTREDTVALVRIEPLATQRFRARFRFPDGRERSVILAGDEIYIDAHVLKWKPWANFFGLHTAYELDRVAGRYRALSEEQTATRTVYSLGAEKPLDLFALRQRYALLAPALDAEYGSATFVAADRPRVYEIRISTAGLLVRPALWVSTVRCPAAVGLNKL